MRPAPGSSPRPDCSSPGSPTAPDRSAPAFRTGPALDAAAVVFLILFAGSLRPAATAIGPVLSEVIAALHLVGWQTGLLTALPGLVFAVCGLLAIPLLGRLGLFATLVIAAGSIAVGVGGRALSSEWPGFAALTVLALAGMAIGNVVCPVYIRARFPNRTTLAATAFTVSLGLGAAVPTLLTVPLMHAAGTWRAGLGAWSLVPLSALIVWLGLRAARSVPVLAGSTAPAAPGTGPEAAGPSGSSGPEAPGTGPEAGGPSGSTGPEASGTGPEAVSPAPETAGRQARRPVYASGKARWMGLFFGLQSVNAYVQFGWLPQIYRDGGIDATGAGLLAALVAFSGIVGGFLAPQIVMRGILPRTAIASFAAASTLGYLGLLLSPSAPAVLWAVLLAWGGFAFPTVLTLITKTTRDVRITAATSAFVQSSGYVLAAVCPFLVGTLLGASGGWTAPLLLMIAVSVVMGISGVLAAGPGLVDDELRPPSPQPPQPPPSPPTPRRPDHRLGGGRPHEPKGHP